MADDLGTRTAADVNQSPGQWQNTARKRKAGELAEFFRRRGITHTTMQTMHPAVLEHHWRAAGLKGAPSEDMLKELSKKMRPGSATTAGGAI